MFALTTKKLYTPKVQSRKSKKERVEKFSKSDAVEFVEALRKHNNICVTAKVVAGRMFVEIERPSHKIVFQINKVAFQELYYHLPAFLVRKHFESKEVKEFVFNDAY